MSSIYQQFQTCLLFKKPVVVVEGLEIKLDLLGDASYASRYYLNLHNFKPVMEIWIKFCLTDK